MGPCGPKTQKKKNPSWYWDFNLLAYGARNACWCNSGKNVMEVTNYFLTGFFYSTLQDKVHPGMNWNHPQPRSVIRQVLHPNGGSYCYATKQT